MGFMQEFKEFAVKGNAVDMAVGIILGAAFNKVVTSIVNDLVMPPIGYLIGGVEFRDLGFTLKDAVINEVGVETAAAVVVRYGNFINTVIDFLLVALAVFFVVKVMNRMMKKREADPA